MNIGQAAKISGLTVKTVRYYDNIGLVKAYQNSDNHYRVYSKDDIGDKVLGGGWIDKTFNNNLSTKLTA